ncbi:M60 family metallopeptidase [Bacillus niameyensis]|uniref:M60 family metallopeptidase n=1 Tax=Bacillus niameyensis TaxID=1522308 RepID=UPI0007846CF1|nr:M60 family metallopeptidase [Bacillus niameyensis]
MTSESTQLLQKTIELEQHGTLAAERERLRVSFGPSYYQPTGCFIKKGEKFQVVLHETDQTLLPRIVISPAILTEYKIAANEGTELKVGENEIEAPEGGILYFINESTPTELPAKVTISGGRSFPTFELGKTTVSEWEEQLKNCADAPVFELLTSKVMITAGMNFAELVPDPTNILEAHDKVVELQAQLSGLSLDDEEIHQPTKFRYHFRQTKEPGYYMYAYFNHTAYSEEGMPFILDVNKFKNDGWGPWHELGHVHQQTAWTPDMFVEVTVNLFSLTVQRYFGGNSRLEVDGVYDKAFAYLESEQKDFANLDVWEKLVMLWQLELAYGRSYYPSIFRMIRETPISEIPKTDEERLQKIILWTSKAAKQNLMPVFAKWGLTPTEEIKQQILELDLMELNQEVWKLRDDQ